MDLISSISLSTMLYFFQTNLAIASPDRSDEKTALMIKPIKSNRPDPINLKSESFRSLVLDSDIVLDRSLFIKEILEHDEKRIIMTFPTKWSKTINLDMLKTFVEAEINPSSKQPLPPNETFAYKLFKYGKALNGMQIEDFKTPFFISRHSNIIDKYLAQHPVIYINFKSVRGFNDIEYIHSVASLLKQVYTSHTYLTDVLARIHRNANETVERDKAGAYLNHINRILDRSENDRESITNSLNLLSKLLYRHHRKRVFVLIDDYDLPFHKLKHLSYAPQSDIKQVLTCLEKTLNPILAENNEYVERVVITGTLSIVDILGPHGKTIPHYTMANNRWIEYFGITEHQQQQLCTYMDETAKRCRNAASWYLGYKSNVDPRLNLGQPYSMAKFLELKMTKIYWPQNFQHTYLYNFISMKPIRVILESLINNNNHTVAWNNMVFTKDQISLLKKITAGDFHNMVNRSTVNLVVSYICAGGFLTFVTNPKNGTAEVWIPNIESMTEMCRKLKSYYQNNYGISFTFVDPFVNNIGQYIMNKKDAPPSWRTHISMNHLFRNVKHSSSIDENEYYSDLMYAMLNFISIKLRSWMQFQTKVWREKTSPVSYMIATRHSSAALFALGYNQDIHELMASIKRRRDLLQKHQYLQARKFIVISLDSNKVASLHTECDYIMDYGGLEH